jgi:heptosyltransferase-3
VTPADVSTLLFLHQGAIGDFILALSLVQAVAAKARTARVIAVASAPSAGLAAGRSIINQRRLPDQVGLHTLYTRDSAADPRLRTLLSDASYVLSFLGRADGPVHHHLAEATHASVLSVDPRPRPETLDQRRHITDQWRDDITRSGLELTEITPPVIRLDAPQRPADDSRPVITLHPGSGGRAKCWPIEGFMTLAGRLHDCRVKWMLGPAECESDDIDVKTIRRRCENHDEALVVEDEFLKAADHIAATDLYVGNDAGMTHLAAAMGRPTVAIFGPTDPAAWRPLGEHVSSVSPPHPGMPIDTVSVDALADAVRVRLADIS